MTQALFLLLVSWWPCTNFLAQTPFCSQKCPFFVSSIGSYCSQSVSRRLHFNLDILSWRICSLLPERSCWLLGWEPSRFSSYPASCSLPSALLSLSHSPQESAGPCLSWAQLHFWVLFGRLQAIRSARPSLNCCLTTQGQFIPCGFFCHWFSTVISPSPLSL